MQNVLKFALFWLCLVSTVYTEHGGVENILRKLYPRHGEAIHLIEECIQVESKEGHYYYKSHSSKDAGQTCGVYLMTDPDKNIEIEFTHLDINCHDGGAISIIDGWEMSGEYFPSPQDHPLPLDERITTTCGSQIPKKSMVSSQNAALVLYSVPEQGQGFSFRVRFLSNPKPCNVLVEGTSDIYTLSNHGRAINCSVTLALAPATVNLLSLHIGGVHPRSGLMHKCEERGQTDYVEIGGSSGLDASKMERIDSICGTANHLGSHPKTFGCIATTVRLVSSGRYHNAVKLEIRPAEDEELFDPAYSCF